MRRHFASGSTLCVEPVEQGIPRRSSAVRFGMVSGAALVMALGAFAAPGAFAQAASQTDKSDTGNTVVVTGTALPTEYDKIGSSITVIDDQLIEDGGYSYVPDVLRQVPGLAISRSGPLGGLTQVRTRGAEGNHTVVLFNGVDVSDAGNGETDLSTLLSGNIERIEVLRGPQSGLYGSNALAGVINILTRKNIDGTYTSASGEYGSFNTALGTVGYGLGNGRTFVDAGVTALSSDGYDISALGAVNGPPGVTGDEEGYSNVTGYVSGGMELSPILRVDGFARYATVHAELDGQDFNGGVNQGQTYDDASETFTQTYNVAGSGTLSLMDGAWVTVASASYTRNRAEGKDGIPFDEYGDRAWRSKYGVQSSYRFGPDNFVSTVTGFAELKKEYYRNTHPFDPSQVGKNREMKGIGAQYQAEIDNQFYLSATARHDDNDTFEAADTYSVAGSWVVPNTGTRPHASYGTGVTNPSFFEQFGFVPGTFLGNSNLTPEKAWGGDIGVEQTLLDDRLVADITYFRSELEDEIVGCTVTNPAPPPATLSSSCNSAQKSNREGIEVSAKYYPTDDIDLIASYTHLDATQGTAKVTEVRRPDNQAALDANWRVMDSKLQLTLGVTYTGEYTDTSFVTFLPQTVDAYSLVRLAASYKLTDTVELYGRVENLFDEDYEEVLSYLGTPRTVYVGVRFKDGTAK